MFNPMDSNGDGKVDPLEIATMCAIIDEMEKDEDDDSLVSEHSLISENTNQSQDSNIGCGKVLLCLVGIYLILQFFS